MSRCAHVPLRPRCLFSKTAGASGLTPEGHAQVQLAPGTYGRLDALSARLVDMREGLARSPDDLAAVRGGQHPKGRATG